MSICASVHGTLVLIPYQMSARGEKLQAFPHTQPLFIQIPCVLAITGIRCTSTPIAPSLQFTGCAFLYWMSFTNMCNGVGAAAVNSILIIDDDPIIQRVVSAMLATEGLHIRTAGSVAEGLGLIAQETPDLTICDMVMSHASGLDFIKHCRQDPFLVQMPIIIISGSSGHNLIEEALREGAFACLPKPFSKMQIAETVRMALQEKV